SNFRIVSRRLNIFFPQLKVFFLYPGSETLARQWKVSSSVDDITTTATCHSFPTRTRRAPLPKSVSASYRFYRDVSLEATASQCITLTLRRRRPTHFSFGGTYCRRSRRFRSRELQFQRWHPRLIAFNKQSLDRRVPLRNFRVGRR